MLGSRSSFVYLRVTVNISLFHDREIGESTDNWHKSSRKDTEMCGHISHSSIQCDSGHSAEQPTISVKSWHNTDNLKWMDRENLSFVIYWIGIEFMYEVSTCTMETPWDRIKSEEIIRSSAATHEIVAGHSSETNSDAGVWTMKLMRQTNGLWRIVEETTNIYISHTCAGKEDQEKLRDLSRNSGWRTNERNEVSLICMYIRRTIRKCSGRYHSEQKVLTRVNWRYSFKAFPPYSRLPKWFRSLSA